MRTDYISFSDVQRGSVSSDSLMCIPSLPVSSLKDEVDESALQAQVSQNLFGVQYKCQMRNWNDNLLKKCERLTGRLYSHRATSKAFFRSSRGTTPEEKQQFLQAKIATMEKEVKWLYDTYTEMVGISKTLASSLDDLNSKWEGFKMETSSQYLLSLASVLAEVHCMDIVKATKLSIQNDINTFQDLAVSMKQWELSEYAEELSGFYSAAFSGVKELQKRLDKYQKMDVMLYQVLTHLLDLLEKKGHSLSQLVPVRLSILKAVPVLVYLLYCQNGKYIEKKGVARAMNLMKRNPVLPVIGDSWMSSMGLLSTLDGLETKFHIRNYLTPQDFNEKDLQNTDIKVHICDYVQQLKPIYNSTLFELCKCISQIQKVGLDSNVIPKGLAESAMSGYKKVLNLVHACQWQLQSFFYWKVSSSNSRSANLQGHSPDDNLSSRIVSLFSEEEKLAISSLMQTLKDLNQYVLTREFLLFPVLSAHMQDRINTLQAEALQKVALSKKSSDLFKYLQETLSSLASSPMRDDQLELGGGPSLSQLVLINEIVGEFGLEIEQQKKKKFFKESGSSGVLKELQSFNLDAILFCFVLEEEFSFSRAADTSYLWLHEQLFDKMTANKSSIATSLPWSLFEAQIDSMRQDLDLEMALVPMNIYNKATHTNLTNFEKQCIQDEIETEADLAYDRMTFKIATKVYEVVKMTVSGQHLSRFVNPDELRNEELLSKQNVKGILYPRVHNLLGRNINLRKMITQRVNKLFRENLDYLMERFEALDISQGILEFHTGYHILQSAHVTLSEYLKLDSWETITKEMNESTSNLSFGSRLCVYIYKELASFVPLYYNYYLSASKFIEDRNDNVSRREFRKPALPVLPSPSFLFGHRIYNETIREISKRHSGTFSSMHYQCLAQLLSEEEIFLVVQKLLEKVYKIVSNSLLPNLKECMEVMDEASCFSDIESPEAILESFEGIVRSFESHQEEDGGSSTIFEDLKTIGNIMLSIFHLSNVENTARSPHMVLCNSMDRGLNILRSGHSKGLEINDMTFTDLEQELASKSKPSGCTSLFAYSVTSLKKLFEDYELMASKKGLTNIFNAIYVSFCQDNKDQVQNIQRYGDTVPFAFVLLTHVFEVVNPFLLLDCVQLMTERDEELPMHMKFLVDNAKHFYGCSKAFKAVIVGVN